MIDAVSDFVVLFGLTRGLCNEDFCGCLMVLLLISFELFCFVGFVVLVALLRLCGTLFDIVFISGSDGPLWFYCAMFCVLLLLRCGERCDFGGMLCSCEFVTVGVGMFYCFDLCFLFGCVFDCCLLVLILGCLLCLFYLTCYLLIIWFYLFVLWLC